MTTPRRPRVTPAAPVHPPLVAAVRQTVDAMTWLTPSDVAMVELAFRYASEIEAAVGTANQSKLVGWLGPHLANTLKTLGGAPVERRELVGEEAVGGRLAQLRAARQ